MCVRPDELVFGTSYAVDRLPYAHAPDRARGRARRSAATAAAAKIGRVDRLRGPRRRAGRGGGPGRHDRRAAQDRRSAAGTRVPGVADGTAPIGRDVHHLKIDGLRRDVPDAVSNQVGGEGHRVRNVDRMESRV